MASLGIKRFSQGITLHKFLKQTGGNTSQFILEGHHYSATKTRQNVKETPDKIFLMNTKILIQIKIIRKKRKPQVC